MFLSGRGKPREIAGHKDTVRGCKGQDRRAAEEWVSCRVPFSRERVFFIWWNKISQYISANTILNISSQRI
jgi:hypothetical protein